MSWIDGKSFWIYAFVYLRRGKFVCETTYRALMGSTDNNPILFALFIA